MPPLRSRASRDYARLCAPFVVAKVLQFGTLDIAHLRGDALDDMETHRLATLVHVVVDDNPDPNALAPQSVEVRLTDGRILEWRCQVMLANPARPLTREAHLEKFRRCWAFAADPLPADAREALISMVDDLGCVTEFSGSVHR